jgi:hypothetical protein
MGGGLMNIFVSMEKQMKRLGWCSIMLLLGLLQGCSDRMWYDGLKQGQAIECSKLQGKERDDCQKDTGVSYDQYQRERREVLKKDQD